MNQADKVAQLQTPECQKAFTSQRAVAQYVDVNSRPDICAKVPLVGHGGDLIAKKELK